MIDLRTASAKDFLASLEEQFTATLPEGGTLALQLIEVNERAGSDASGRIPFSLLFRGPLEPLLGQAIWPLENAASGAIDVFLVPIGQDADGTLYEAVFT